MKTGLVLEGGAMRGMFTAGVLDVLMEHDITVDGAIGVSAGAVFGCNYKSHQIGRTIRYNTQYCNDKRYASFKNLLRTGNLYSEQFCYHDVPESWTRSTKRPLRPRHGFLRRLHGREDRRTHLPQMP